MAGSWLDVCACADLHEAGDGVRFEWDGRAAFVVRFGSRAHAFLNRCVHRSVELDWIPGRFFDDAGLYLICAMHGASYEASSGRCVLGPCQGGALTELRCEEHDGRVRVFCPSRDPRVAMARTDPTPAQ